jgi:hypothetical protein
MDIAKIERKRIKGNELATELTNRPSSNKYKKDKPIRRTLIPFTSGSAPASEGKAVNNVVKGNSSINNWNSPRMNLNIPPQYILVFSPIARILISSLLNIFSIECMKTISLFCKFFQHPGQSKS